jgi:granule-bound starch synthase
LQDVYQPRGQFKNAKVAYCIHNIAFQGRFWPESFKDMQLPQSTMSKLGFIDGYSKVRYLMSDPSSITLVMTLCCK